MSDETAARLTGNARESKWHWRDLFEGIIEGFTGFYRSVLRRPKTKYYTIAGGNDEPAQATERLDRWRQRARARKSYLKRVPEPVPKPEVRALVHVPKPVKYVPPSEKRSNFGLYALLIAALIFAAWGGITLYNSFNHPVEGSGSVVAPSGAVPGVVPTANAAETWKLAYSDYGDNRWFSDGIAEIKNAKTKTDAEQAAQAWLNRLKPDPNLLAAAASIILEKDVDKATLFDKDGWATPVAVQLVAEMQLALATAKIEVANAPTNGTNTGVSNNQVVSSVHRRISGNRHSIKITFADGRVIYVLGRCGNIVTTDHPHFPPGDTDEKDPSDDPAARGNAPRGGGTNEDPGPGEYQTSTEVTRPSATPRSNPPAPSTTTIPIGSTPDPAPAPAPEPTAPTPSHEATGHAPAPGKS